MGELGRAWSEVLLAWGKAFLALYDDIFKSWHRFKDGGMCRKGPPRLPRTQSKRCGET